MSNNFLIHPQRGGRGNFPPQSVSESLMLHSKLLNLKLWHWNACLCFLQEALWYGDLPILGAYWSLNKRSKQTNCQINSLMTSINCLQWKCCWNFLMFYKCITILVLNCKMTFYSMYEIRNTLSSPIASSFCLSAIWQWVHDMSNEGQVHCPDLCSLTRPVFPKHRFKTSYRQYVLE